MQIWKEHFKNQLRNPLKVTNKTITKIINNQLDIKLGDFTQEKIDLVRTKSNKRKAAGLDKIPSEIWRTRKFDDLLLRYCNAVYNENKVDRWIIAAPSYSLRNVTSELPRNTEE